MKTKSSTPKNTQPKKSVALNSQPSLTAKKTNSNPPKSQSEEPAQGESIEKEVANNLAIFSGVKLLVDAVSTSKLPSLPRSIVLTFAIAQSGLVVGAAAKAAWFYAMTAGLMLIVTLFALIYVRAFRHPK